LIKTGSSKAALTQQKINAVIVSPRFKFLSFAALKASTTRMIDIPKNK